jgi:dihydrofolate reductase
MRKLIIEEWISLDGYASDRDNKLDFFAPMVRDTYKDEYYTTCLDGIDCILFGKNTYKQFSSLWPERTGDFISDKINTCERFVFSKSLTTAPWGKWEPAKILSGDLKPRIKELKSLPGKNIVIWGSLSLAQQAIQDRLVDEYHLHICPIITGGGSRLLTAQGQISLKLIHSKRFENGMVSLHYHTHQQTS